MESARSRISTLPDRWTAPTHWMPAPKHLRCSSVTMPKVEAPCSRYLLLVLDVPLLRSTTVRSIDSGPKSLVKNVLSRIGEGPLK